jgi:hypothetical protein
VGGLRTPRVARLVARQAVLRKDGVLVDAARAAQHASRRRSCMRSRVLHSWVLCNASATIFALPCLMRCLMDGGQELQRRAQLHAVALSLAGQREAHRPPHDACMQARPRCPEARLPGLIMSCHRRNSTHANSTICTMKSVDTGAKYEYLPASYLRRCKSGLLTVWLHSKHAACTPEVLGEAHHAKARLAQHSATCMAVPRTSHIRASRQPLRVAPKRP